MFPAISRFLLMGLLACASNPVSKPVSEKPVEKQTTSTAKKSVKPEHKSESKSEKKVRPAKAYDEDLGEIEKRYAAAKTVKMDVKKSLILSALERTDIYEGRFLLSGKEKLRLEFEKPVKSVAVLNGKEFWIIEYPPADVDDKVRVLKSTLGEKSQSQVLITSLMGRGRILDHFSIEKKKKKDGKIIFAMKPTGSASEIINLELVVNEADKLIAEMSYEDELENKTKFEFSKVEFDSDMPEKLFTYAPPKGAEISQL
jgi:outer membrane lipoprotein carrier protein